MTAAVAVVTGAARGIGRAIAADLVARGYRVVIGDLDLAATTATARELGTGVIAVRLDVTDAALMAESVAEIERSVGPIAVWVNNAGIMPTGPFVSHSRELIDAVISVDFQSLVETTALVFPGMLRRKSGNILNVASATAVKPLAGLAVYSATKAAVVAFSDALRRELRGSGVTVGVILPNLVSTAMGAGITAPRGFGAVTAPQVARAAMRALERGTFATVVPRHLGPMLRVSRLLPVSVQDWMDDRIGTDRIGLGGDATARETYLTGVVPPKNDAPPRHSPVDN